MHQPIALALIANHLTNLIAVLTNLQVQMVGQSLLSFANFVKFVDLQICAHFVFQVIFGSRGFYACQPDVRLFIGVYIVHN